MRVADMAFGEALWALTRGALYAAAFLLVVLALGAWTGEPMLRSSWAWLAWPAAVLVSGTFAAIALCITSFARRIEDFDVVMGLVVMPMFLFSGIFFPLRAIPRCCSGWCRSSRSITAWNCCASSPLAS
jgi:lipooligosaccharide transport system permease protein